MAPGSADKSYGIEVARLAGLPGAVIQRAREILRVHEKTEEQATEELSPGARHAESEATTAQSGKRAASSGANGGASAAPAAPPQQSSFTAIDERVLKAIREAELNKLTPIETMNLLAELQKQLA